MNQCAQLETNQMNASVAKTTAIAANAEPTNAEAPISGVPPVYGFTLCEAVGIVLDFVEVVRECAVEVDAALGFTELVFGFAAG